MPTVLSTDDVLRLEKAAPCLRDQLLVRMGYLYGPRRSEFVLLEVQDIDYSQHRMRIPVLKRERGAWRWVPLDPRTEDILREYIRGAKLKRESRLFPITPSHISHLIADLAKTAGLGPLTPPDGSKRRRWGVSPHRLRDFSVTRRLTAPNMQEKGLEGLKAVADFHGHKDPRSTLRYLRLTEGWREEVFLSGMEELLKPEGEKP